MKVFSEEWAKAYVDSINNNANYKAAASWWEGDFLFVVEPSGNLDKEVRLFVGLFKGDCTGAKILKPGEEHVVLKAGSDPVPLKEGEPPSVEFVFSGNYDNWLKVLKKELDPIQGLMAGKFKLVGNMAKVMRATKAAQELVNSSASIEGVEFF
ncbi:MAG: SCP2 sterol-binding domain-containing protein [Promethearchaeota archaeon]